MRKGKERESGFYDRIHAHSKHKQRNKAIWRIILKELIREPNKILDLGCGGVAFGMLCLQHGHVYVGVDFSQVAIDDAKAKMPEGEYHLVDLREDLDIIEQGDYDTIIAIEFFEHINKDREVIEAIPSGKRVVFSVPNFWSKDHVRVFENEEAIISRYGALLDIKKTFMIAKRKTRKKVVVDSIKR